MAVELEQRPGRRPQRPGRARRPSPPRWIEAIPTGLLIVAAIVKVVVSPNAARDAVTNVRPLALTLAVAAAWLLLWLWLLPRFVRNGWVRTGILLVVAVGLSLALILPSVRDKKVVETFPGAAGSSATSAPSTGDAPAAGSTPTTAPAPAEPVRLGAGALTGIDHDATGTVALYEQPDGSFVVGLEGIDIEPGPDYFVHLVPGAGRTEPDGGIELERLRGNQGTQFYVLPAGTTVTARDWTVLIWCRAFAVPVAHATPV